MLLWKKIEVQVSLAFQFFEVFIFISILLRFSKRCFFRGQKFYFELRRCADRWRWNGLLFVAPSLSPSTELNTRVLGKACLAAAPPPSHAAHRRRRPLFWRQPRRPFRIFFLFSFSLAPNLKIREKAVAPGNANNAPVNEAGFNSAELRRGFSVTGKICTHIRPGMDPVWCVPGSPSSRFESLT
jgi:hypothetical protein